MSEAYHYKGGCFSLRVAPVFCGNGNLVGIPKGRRSSLCFFETLGNGETLYTFPLCPEGELDSNQDVITGLGVAEAEGFELVLASTYSGKLGVFSVEEEEESSHSVKHMFTWETGKKIVDLRTVSGAVFVLCKDEDATRRDSSRVSLYRIDAEDMTRSTGSRSRSQGDRKVEGDKVLRKMVSFSYGASNLRVSEDGTLFCFTWKNILIIWTPKYKNKIIRFRHSEFILSFSLSRNGEFIVTGDAYGRLVYWFLPHLDSEEGSKMWQEAPLVTEKSSVDEMIYKYNIKTSMSHWHSHELKALSTVPETNVVVSGGEESVLVLWRQEMGPGSFNNGGSDCKHRNGNRQFIPRLGAPIYAITTYFRKRSNESDARGGGVWKQKTGNPASYDKAESLSPVPTTSQKSALPQLIAGVVCSDNSIKIIDLVHTKLINCIYGISVPFGLIKSSHKQANLFDTTESLECNVQTFFTNGGMRLVGTKFLDPTRLLVSIIGNPFKLHIHDVIKDYYVSSVICRPEETYVSGVGTGISSSKLLKQIESQSGEERFGELGMEENTSTRIFITYAYFSRKGNTVLTVECRRYDNMGGKRRAYNLNFWKADSDTQKSVKFSLVSEYQTAHTENVISIQEAEYVETEEGREVKGVCLFTIARDSEIKCWMYKEQIGEWINFSIVSGSADCENNHRMAYSACYNSSFDRLFVSVSGGILVYRWSKHNCILMESNYIPLKTIDLFGGDVVVQTAARERDPDRKCDDALQIISLSMIENDLHFLLGLSNLTGRLYLWDMDTLKLINKYELRSGSAQDSLKERGNTSAVTSTEGESPDHFRLVEVQNEDEIRLYSRSVASFRFSLVGNSGKALLFNLVPEKAQSDGEPQCEIQLVKQINIAVPKETTILDSIIQYVLNGPRISFYITFLLSSCELYCQLIEDLPRLGGEDSVFLHDSRVSSDKAKECGDDCDNLKDSISRMYISSFTKDEKEAPGNKANSLSNVSDAVKLIISDQSGSGAKNEMSDENTPLSEEDVPLSVLFSIQKDTIDDLDTKNYQIFSRISENINTFMCPSASSLLWSILRDNSSLSLIQEKNDRTDPRVRHFDQPEGVRADNSSSSGRDHNEKRSMSTRNQVVDKKVLFGPPLKPMQTQKLQSIFKRVVFVSRDEKQSNASPLK